MGGVISIVAQLVSQVLGDGAHQPEVAGSALYPIVRSCKASQSANRHPKTALGRSVRAEEAFIFHSVGQMTIS